MKRLIEIQQKLKAPKSQYNSFWNYHYRSCEDILIAVKPLLAEQKLALTLEDEIVCVWDRTYQRHTDDSKKWKKEDISITWWRFYVKATARLRNENWVMIAETTAFAREEEEKSWQDWSQISWSSSSYARKYALNWMFLCDDWIDSDTTNKWNAEEKAETKKETKRFNKEQLENLKTNTEYLKKFEKSEDLLQDIQKLWYSVSKEMKMKIADVRASVE